MITYNMFTPRPVDTTATYMCNDGFDLIGDSVRSCLEGGIFSGEEPFCLMIRKCVHKIIYIMPIICNRELGLVYVPQGEYVGR